MGTKSIIVGLVVRNLSNLFAVLDSSFIMTDIHKKMFHGYLSILSDFVSLIYFINMIMLPMDSLVQLVGPLD